MKKKKFYRLITLFLSIVPCLSFGQIPDFSKVEFLDPEDSVNIIHLINYGIKLSKGKVIAWFPGDSLSEKRMSEIVDTLNIGIKAAEKFINAPLSWQVQHEGDLYTYYFRTDRFISHGSHAGFVSIPFWRIKNGKAPWLHEAMHEMLNTKAADAISEKEWAAYEPHLWLYEGLPDYISMKVSQQHNLPQFDVFANTTYGNADSLCKQDLCKERSAYILSFIGKKGTMPELYSKDRFTYAPTFYHCSCSFVKYLVEKQGIEPLLNSVSVYPREHEALEKLITPSLDVMKSSWMEKLKN